MQINIEFKIILRVLQLLYLMQRYTEPDDQCLFQTKLPIRRLELRHQLCT